MNLRYETQKLRDGYSFVAGCDEVGRGALAGPVVAAVVLLDVRKEFPRNLIRRVNDSKLLSPEIRSQLSPEIIAASSAWNVGVVSPKVIDSINIHQATLRAMKMAINSISSPLDSDKLCVFVDGKFTVPDVAYKQEAMVDGDAKIFSIAAASVLAKVYRDNLMVKLHAKFPNYNFAQHKGYGTPEHQSNIRRYGLSPIHRRTFCRRLVEN